jgi:hypothetical protein
MIGAWWAKLQCAMWPAAVVVGGVSGKDISQVSFAEDQGAAGEFRSGGQDEAFGEAVRSRTARWDLHGADPGVGENGVERVAAIWVFSTPITATSERTPVA